VTWYRRGPLVVCLLLAAGCTGPGPSAQRPADVPSSAAAVTSERPGKLPPLPDDEPAPSATTRAPAADDDPRGCGVVRAASGAQLQVILGDGVSDCGMAERLVQAFHRSIEQPSRSRHPVRATVDGWDCVSGPPSSQGGTTCSRGAATVLAAVLTDE
jgi:hypothetical protein